MENAGTEKQVIKTREFGEIEFDSDFIFNFPNGLIGFEDLHEFILISIDDTAPFKWLISIDQPEIGFILLSPLLIDESYKTSKKTDNSNEIVFVIIKLEKSKGEMSANMKAPVIIDAELNIGEQIILPSDKFSTNFIIKTVKSSQ